MPTDRPDGISRDPDLTHTSRPGQAGPAPGESRYWGDLRLIEEIGHGGFGRVFRAWDESLAREVALKIIRHADARHRSTVVREGQMLARVTHRGVVAIHRAQQIGDEVGLTMELVRGRTLADVVRQGGPMSAEEAAVVGIHLCHALAAVHAAGLLHRDVKAQNVMRESGGRIVLMDFGSVRESGQWREDFSGSAELAGTPLYLAPELFDGQAASPASDLYSLGVLLFYLATRRFPIEGPTLVALAQQHATGRPHRLADLRPDLPDAFVNVVERAIARARDHRPTTAGALLGELTEAMPGSARSVLPIAPAPSPVPDPGWSRVEARTSATDAVEAEALRRLTPAVRALVAGAGGLLACGLLGMLTSAHYNRTVGRDAGFSDDTIGTWFEMGFRSLVPTAIYLTLLLVAAYVAAAVWHFVQRLVPPARRVTDSARSGISRTLGRLRHEDRLSVAHGLLIAQGLALALVAWIYSPLLATLKVTLNDAAPGALDVLNPSGDNGLLYSYGLVMALLLAVMATSWRALTRRGGGGGPVPRSMIAAGAGLGLITLLLIVLPYRLFYQSEAPRAVWTDQVCYVTGARGNERLLYCPGAPRLQRTPVVPQGDLRAVDQQPGRLFAPPGTPRD